jgi:hypothetical protein
VTSRFARPLDPVPRVGISFGRRRPGDPRPTEEALRAQETRRRGKAILEAERWIAKVKARRAAKTSPAGGGGA